MFHSLRTESWRLCAVLFVSASALLLVACSSISQRLDYQEIDSVKLHKTMSYAVYTPPNWMPEESLPLVIFLHGAGGSYKSMNKFGFGEYLDVEILAGRAPRVVIVAPDGELGFWENWVDGSHDYRDWVLEEVVPAVQEAFGTRACPENCHLMGVSMGGYGAIRMAILERDAIASVSAISAPILNTEQTVELMESFFMKTIVPSRRIWGDVDIEAISEQDPFRVWVEDESLRSTKLFLAWGSEEGDRIRVPNQHFHQHLLENNVPHEALVFEGGHKWANWRTVIVAALQRQLWNGEEGIEPVVGNANIDGQ